MITMRKLWSDPDFLQAAKKGPAVQPADNTDTSAPRDDSKAARDQVDTFQSPEKPAEAEFAPALFPLPPGKLSAEADDGAHGGCEADGPGALEATSTDQFFCKDSPDLTDSDKHMLDAYAKAYKRTNSSESVRIDGYASIEGDLGYN